MSVHTFTQFQILFVVLHKYIVAEIVTRNIESTHKGDVSLLETKLYDTLDPKRKIVLSWELGEDKSVITFELWAQTLGYVGFGISPNGGMAGADILITGVSTDGTPYFSDRFASANELPKVDSHQDWTLLEAKENETTTYLKFSRLVDTCDKDEDYPITKGTNRVIWAVGPTDELVKHSSMDDRGSRSISFLYQRPKLNRTGVKTWIAGLNDFPMPSNDTTFWCTVHESLPLDTPKYVIGQEVYLPDENAQKHIHHMALYKCSLPEDGSFDKTIESLTVNNGFLGFVCFDTKESFMLDNYCHNQPILAFAKGDKDMALPSNVAFKIEKETTKKQYFFLQTHFDNPEKSEGVVLSFGLRALYTDKPRQYDAAMVAINYITHRILIPPNRRNFVYSAHCSSACTEQNLDPSGISILFVQLHAHIYGRKLKLRHFRNGIELPWIAHDDKYDFNYQQYRMLDEERKVLPGDHLTIECEYDTTSNHGKIVLGGSSSSREMCQVMIWYYPKSDNFFGCVSRMEDYEILRNVFNVTKYNFTDELELSTTYIEEPPYLRGGLEDSLSYKFNWSDEFVEQFQRRIQFEDQMVWCSSATVGNGKKMVYSPPKNIIEFVPKETCA